MRPHDKHADHLALELAPTYVRTYVCAYASEEEDEGEDHAPSGGAALVSAPTDAAAHLADSLSCAAANANAANGNHGSF